ncbi:MAG: flagellar basal body-associated FliL family protein [Alphaproteobacteria bacterium]|nr:flagellar basal body-associated FliL family protein [Alphaproteobacteria bacterium]MDE2336181.1 flagellar basal body-associated FliL family protein [Alphaproteobacteria bacterium]
MAEDKKAKKGDKSDDDKLKAEKPGANDAAENAENAAEGEAAAAPRFTRKKIILLAVLVVALLAALGGGAYYMGFLDKIFPPKKPSCENVQPGDKNYAACAALNANKSSSAPGVFIKIPPMIVNLNASSNIPRFLKVELEIEVPDDAAKSALEDVMPRVIDQFQMYLRELRLSDLRGSAGIYRMKIELLSRVRAAAPDVKITDVLFQEILVQ